MNEFNLFRINCWLEDIEDSQYESSISAIVYELLMTNDNNEQLRNDIFDLIKNVLGIKINYEKFIAIIDSNSNFILEPLDDDIYVKLTDESVQKFRDRLNKYSIESFISKFCKNNNGAKEDTIKEVLLKSLYININSFTVSDLKSLISESVRNDFSQDDIDLFNSFLDWRNPEKDKSIYALFSKSIEFAILTSGRGISSISNKIFTNKTYYLDTNVVIRALGVDGVQRQESTVSIIESCCNDGIKFKLSKVSYDEIYKNLNRRIKDVKKKTSTDAEKILCKIIEEIPINNSFETDYIKRRKAGKVSSPNNYRLSLEKQFQLFCDKYQVEVEPIKGIKQYELSQLQKKLFSAKKTILGPRAYSMGAALVDAKNILHVRQVREHNNFNYKDIKSFYLTTDCTLNEIAINENPDLIAETILPSQLFVIHNFFNKKDNQDDYKDFIKFIKVRRTDFNLPGKDVFSMLERIREATSNPDDITSTLKAYANYRFENRLINEPKIKVVPINEFAVSYLENELGKARIDINQLKDARVKGLERLPILFKRASIISYFVEILILSVFSVILSLIKTNTNITVVLILGIVLFRIILFLMKDKFGINRAIRNFFFDLFVQKQNFIKVLPNDKEYLNQVIEMKKNTT